MDGPSPRVVARTVLVVVGICVALYLIYLLRRPVGWLLIATFLAVALSGPVNYLNRRMRRGFAIAIVYLSILAVPVILGSLMVPPLVKEGNNLADNAPQYARDVTKFVNDNKKLREINRDYDVTEKLQNEAEKLPSKLGGAATTLRDVGFGIVSSIFALVTILILSAFMLKGGRGWISTWLRYFPEHEAERIERVLGRAAKAVGNYVAGALAQASLAGILSYTMLWILDVPFAAPLAVIIFFLDLIPLIGATIGAVLVAFVTVFADFPTVTIIWVIFSIVYQQVENNLVQPQIQKRAVNINPFLVVVAVLFGSALLGILGALVAVPVAASLQIAAREYAEYRDISPRKDGPPDGPSDEGDAPDGGEDPQEDSLWKRLLFKGPRRKPPDPSEGDTAPA
jgi:predicted PurR-regulated permease PerM